jgi:hypothetical protein
VGGGVKAVERRRFEIPKKSWHGFCLVGIRQRSGGKAGRRKKGFALEVKKIPVEEDGISNRQDSTTFVPPLTPFAPPRWKACGSGLALCVMNVADTVCAIASGLCWPVPP